MFARELEVREWEPNVTVAVEPRNDGRTAYPHQAAAWDAMDRHYGPDGNQGGPHDAGMLVVPTGGGKTYIATRWLLRKHISRGGRVLWLTHRRSLLRQAFNAFVESAHNAAPREQLRLISISSDDASWSQVTNHDVVFSTIQSAANSNKWDFINELAHKGDLGLFVVVDEAHHAASFSYQRVLKTLATSSGYRLLGLTATPVRTDDADEKRLWKAFRHIIYQADKRHLIEQGILAKPIPVTVDTKVDFERDFTERDFEHLDRYGELAARVMDRIGKHSARNQLIVKHYKENAQAYGKTIVFAANVGHAQTLAQEFLENGVSADYVDYTRGAESQEVMSAYRDGSEPVVLANVEMLTEGFDAPKTRTVFIARPTQSQSLLAQMVGRALRGPRAGGDDVANLVTFVDTWSRFHVVEADYVVNEGPVSDAESKQSAHQDLVPLPADLLREVYKLLKSNVRGDFLGVHACLPHSWRRWDREYENGEIQTRSVLIFDNQVDGFRRMEADLSEPGAIPENISPERAEALVAEYFGDTQDPLPRWEDVRDLLDARRKELVVSAYTFQEKEAFDPAILAKEYRSENLGAVDIERELKGIFDENAVCRTAYREDFRSFYEEVSRQLDSLVSVDKQPLPPQIIRQVPVRLRDWDEPDSGYSLTRVLDAVLTQRKHFPFGRPLVRDVAWTKRHVQTHWGFFRYSDQSMFVSRTLNSPDVPLFVLEFLVYHEALHADMPNAAHNKNFRDRERRFVPSDEAKGDASRRGIVAGIGDGSWRVFADQFLDTFQSRFIVGKKVIM